MIDELMNHPNLAIQRAAAVAVKAHRGARLALDRKDLSMTDTYHDVRESSISFVSLWGGFDPAEVRAAIILLERHTREPLSDI